MRSSIPTVVGFFRVLKSIGSQSLLNEVKYSNEKMIEKELEKELECRNPF